MSLNHKIEQLLYARKLTKTAFSKKLGLSRETVYNLNEENIKLSTLSEILEVPVTHFLESDTEPPKKNDKKTECESQLLAAYIEINELRKRIDTMQTICLNDSKHQYKSTKKH